MEIHYLSLSASKRAAWSDLCSACAMARCHQWTLLEWIQAYTGFMCTDGNAIIMNWSAYKLWIITHHRTKQSIGVDSKHMCAYSFWLNPHFGSNPIAWQTNAGHKWVPLSYESSQNYKRIFFGDWLYRFEQSPSTSRRLKHTIGFMQLLNMMKWYELFFLSVCIFKFHPMFSHVFPILHCTFFFLHRHFFPCGTGCAALMLTTLASWPWAAHLMTHTHRLRSPGDLTSTKNWVVIN